MATSSIVIVIGTVEDMLLTVTQCSDGAAIDLTGLPIELEIANVKGSVVKAPVILKTEADFVLRTQSGATLGQADLKLSATDTAKLTKGNAIVTVYVTESGDRRRVLRLQITVEA